MSRVCVCALVLGLFLACGDDNGGGTGPTSSTVTVTYPAGGTIFIGATADNKFLAFDVESGEEIWTQKMPKGSFAHPMTYEINGKQYVVVASGGHPFVDQDPGDYVTAFALPE